MYSVDTIKYCGILLRELGACLKLVYFSGSKNAILGLLFQSLCSTRAPKLIIGL